MRWLPYHRLILNSPLPVEQAAEALVSNVGKWNLFGFGDSTPLVGTFSGNRLRCSRRISYRNSFLPLVDAELESTAQGSRIVGVVRPFHSTAIFMLFWFGGLGAMLLLTLIGPVDPGAGEQPWLFPCGMIALGAVLCLGGFAFEFQNTIDELKLVLRGAEEGVDEFLG